MSLRELILDRAAGYEAFKRAIRADRPMEEFVTGYLKPITGERILDVGCGTGDIVAFLPDVGYLGVDTNVDYIRKARSHAPANADFRVLSAGELSPLELGSFDAVIAIGVFHHLSDDIVAAMIESATRMLKSDGRLVAIDPTWDPEQRTTARLLAALDRGRYVREPQGYARLVEQGFSEVTTETRQDLLPFPYTHCITVGRGPRQG